MKKTVLIIATVFTLTASALAAPVSTAVASRVAANFWVSHRPAGMSASVTPKVLDFPELNQLYVFDMESKGFVIVAADDCVQPILAYSFSNPFPNTLNPEIAYWLQGYNDQIAKAVSDGYLQRESTLQKWEWLTLKAHPSDSAATSLTAVHPLLTTMWDQGAPYNKYCPYDSIRNDRTVVGCVATAMAQIMKYWNYPSCGQGFHSYTPLSYTGSQMAASALGTISADFEQTTYLWEMMPSTLTNFSATTSINPVALLSHHCGVAVEMMYGVSATGGSAAYSSCGFWASACATSAFSNFFKYDSSLFYANRNQYSDSAWKALIDANLAERRPMYYDGSDHSGGHAFVLDGSDNEGRYHFNWGWSGFGDGFYTIDNLAPGSGGAGGNATYTFNDDQGAIFNLFPAYTETFDTIDVYDSTCNNQSTFLYYEHILPATTLDTLVRHLNSYVRLHLKTITRKVIFLNPNMSGSNPLQSFYCPADGFTFPACPFTKEGSLFAGWSRSKHGDDTIYRPGETIAINANRTFFALWIDTTTAVPIAEAEAESTLQAWPNPTSGEVNIAVADEAQRLIVYDAQGREVMRKELPNGTTGRVQFSLAALPAGCYRLQIVGTKGIYNQPIIKQ